MKKSIKLIILGSALAIAGICLLFYIKPFHLIPCVIGGWLIGKGIAMNQRGE